MRLGSAADASATSRGGFGWTSLIEPIPQPQG